jgi:hypothetical protein
MILVYSRIRAGTVYPQYWKQKSIMLVYSCIRAGTVYAQYWKQIHMILVYSHIISALFIPNIGNKYLT